MQHLNFCKIITSCHWSFHYTFTYSTILVLGSILVTKLRNSNISGLPLIAKEFPLYCNQYILSILNPSNYVLISVFLFFAILYHMWSVLRLWKTWIFFYSVSIMFQKWEPFHRVVLLCCLFKDFTHIAFFNCYFLLKLMQYLWNHSVLTLETMCNSWMIKTNLLGISQKLWLTNIPREKS